MPAKQLHFGEKARADILSGINKLANAVKVTLGHAVAMSSSIRNSVRLPRPKTVSPSPKKFS
mgnify:CR=1 FL=1